MSRTTREGPSGNQPDDGDCAVCGGTPDGIDARLRAPICEWCSRLSLTGDDGLRADGGRVEEHLHVAVDAHGNPVHLYRDLDDAEAAVESDAYAYSHVAGVWPDVPLISASEDGGDVDCGDGVETDGGPELVMGRRSRVEECDCGSTVIGYLAGDACPGCGEVIYS